MRILLYCDFALPDSCADATRVINLAKLLRDSGHEVTLLGVQYKADGITKGEYDGFAFEMLRAGQWFGLKSLRRIRGLEKDIKQYLSEHTGKNAFDAIFLSGIYYDFTKEFFKYSKRNGAKLVVNALEWYDKRNPYFVGLRGKINFVKNRIALMRIFVKIKNVFAISSLLDDYYKARGCNTVTVPTIIDIREYESVAKAKSLPSPKIRIAYAGMPDRKDYIINAVRALALLSEEERAKLELHFYGPKDDYLATLGLAQKEMDACFESVICHGRIPHSEVKGKIAQADFTVLLRPNKRYANAGFPTKVGESMACGTPVIANLTSDLGKYVLDGKTGIVCINESPVACAEAFRRAIAMTVEERQAMQSEALAMACSAFDYRVYLDAVNAFLNR